MRASEWQAMRAAGVHHVSINVSDVQEALTFYVDVLGMSPRTDRPDFGFDGAWLDVGGQQVHLIAGEVPPGKGQHFAVLVDDIAATVDELRGRGIDISDPMPVGTGQQSFLQDPSGNLIEIHQPG